MPANNRVLAGYSLLFLTINMILVLLQVHAKPFIFKHCTCLKYPLYYCFLIILSLLFLQDINGQKTPTNWQRCGTMDLIENRAKSDQQYQARLSKGLAAYKASIGQEILSGPVNTNILSAPVIIPVVVHIVLPDPALVTDDDVNYFINRLNEDFSGLNADSINATPFYAVRGHSMIRFALARRDPSGNYTPGIERKTGTGNFSSFEPQPIKQAATGGLNPWPYTDYYNIWVGAGENGVLGISPEIGPGTATTDGVVLDKSVFANNPCYTLPELNLARTAVHEIGHNFGLYHIFSGGCNVVTDFGQLTSAGCALPASLMAAADDTPAQLSPTSGCQTGIITNGCDNAPAGKMYQNFMDYTSDACYSLFTVGQVLRMEWVLQNCRPGYLTTQGHIPPVNAPQVDAALTGIISPGGNETLVNTCARYPLPLCAGTITPKVRIANRGTSVLTSVSIGASLNNSTPVIQAFTVNLVTGQSVVLTLAGINLQEGNNQLRYFTTAPNNTSDQNKGNDTLTQNIVINAAVSTPVLQDFQSAFPPVNWTIVNPDDNFTWEQANTGSRGSNKSAMADNFSHDAVGQVDDLRTMTITTAGLDSLIISFDLAHKNYPGATDQLSVLLSADCGKTFIPVYEKSGEALATAGSSDIGYVNPAAADWQRQRIAVGEPLIDGADIIVAFRNTNDYGNNIFIDSISIVGKVLPAKLKEKGVVIVPNPFHDQFSIWHYLPPVHLKAISIYNISGLLVWQKQFNGDASDYIRVDLTGKPAGMYIIRLLYDDAVQHFSTPLIKY